MKKFRFLLATSLIVGGSSIVGQSVNGDDDESQRRDPVSRIMNLDKDKDGKISKEEAPERLASMFARADADKDGLLSKDELRKAFADRVTDGDADRKRPDGDRGPQFGDREGMRGRGPGGEGRGPRGDGGRPERGDRDGDRERGARGEGMDRNSDRPGSGQQSALMAVLDRDRDGKISEQEISNAVKALKALDKNEDGVIDAEELRSRRRGPDGRDGEGRDGERQSTDRGPRDQADRPGGPEGMRERFGDRRPEAGRSPSPEGFVKMMLERMDKNEDGKLSGDEIPERMAGRLKQIDKNEDGAIDKSELEAMAKQFSSRRGSGANGDRPGTDGDSERRGGPEGAERGRGKRPASDKD